MTDSTTRRRALGWAISAGAGAAVAAGGVLAAPGLPASGAGAAGIGPASASASAGPARSPRAGATATPSPGPTPAPDATATPADGCRDRLAPASDFTAYRIAPGGITLRGVSIDAGECGQRVTTVRVALTRQAGTGRCRPVRIDGSLGPRGSCRSKAYMVAVGTRSWWLRITELPPPGRYLAIVRAVDESGNFEASSRDNRLRLRVR